MQTNAPSSDDSDLRSTCQRTVDVLITRYAWTLLPAADLVELVLGSLQRTVMPHNLEQFIVTHYTLALYEACRQTADPDRRERGYVDLFRYLYRIAYNRWPDLAEEATQSALTLIYEQIDRCHSPTAFLRFALFKLLQAAKELRRRSYKDRVLASLDQVSTVEQLLPAEEQDGLDLQLLDQERRQILLDILAQLPDRLRKVIALKYFAELSDQAIGESLKITVNHVRVLRWQGIQQLRRNTYLCAYFDRLAESAKQSGEDV
ncbi:MAG: sigma-70 family RNA polymerase sigma factor [Chloroflexales bacterium]|nr:sigma-70 family RNA polymerase sigma factor [Chloroflexales bacterium]